MRSKNPKTRRGGRHQSQPSSRSSETRAGVRTVKPIREHLLDTLLIAMVYAGVVSLAAMLAGLAWLAHIALLLAPFAVWWAIAVYDLDNYTYDRRRM